MAVGVHVKNRRRRGRDVAGRRLATVNPGPPNRSTGGAVELTVRFYLPPETGQMDVMSAFRPVASAVRPGADIRGAVADFRK